MSKTIVVKPYAQGKGPVFTARADPLGRMMDQYHRAVRVRIYMSPTCGKGPVFDNEIGVSILGGYDDDETQVEAIRSGFSFALYDAADRDEPEISPRLAALREHDDAISIELEERFGER